MNPKHSIKPGGFFIPVLHWNKAEASCPACACQFASLLLKSAFWSISPLHPNVELADLMSFVRKDQEFSNTPLRQKLWCKLAARQQLGRGQRSYYTNDPRREQISAGTRIFLTRWLSKLPLALLVPCKNTWAAWHCPGTFPGAKARAIPAPSSLWPELGSSRRDEISITYLAQNLL